MISEKLIKKIIKKKLLESLGTYNPVAADQFDQTKKAAFKKIKVNIDPNKIKADPEDPILFLINHLLGTIQEVGPLEFFNEIKNSYSVHHGFMDNFTPTAKWKEEIDTLIEKLSRGKFKKSGDKKDLEKYESEGYKMVPYSQFNDYHKRTTDLANDASKTKEQIRQQVAEILQDCISKDTGIILYHPNDTQKETVLIAKLTSSQARDARYYFDEKLQQMIKSAKSDFEILKQASSFWTGDEDWLDYLEGDEGDLFGFISNIVGFGTGSIFKKAAVKKAAVKKAQKIAAQTDELIDLIKQSDIKIDDKTFVEYISSKNEKDVYTFLKNHLDWSDNHINNFKEVNDTGKEFIKALRDKLKNSEDPDKLINSVIQKIKNNNPDEILPPDIPIVLPPPANVAKHVVEGVNDELLQKYGQAADDVIELIKEFDTNVLNPEHNMTQTIVDSSDDACITFLKNISNMNDDAIAELDYGNFPVNESLLKIKNLFEKLLGSSENEQEKVDLIKVIIQKIKNNNPVAMSDEIVDQGTKEMGKDAAENAAQKQAKNVSDDAVEEAAEETTENVVQQVAQNAIKNKKLEGALHKFASLIPTTGEALKTQDSNGQNFVKILNFLRTNDKIKLNIDPQYIQHLKTTADAVENAIKNNDVTEIIFYLNRIDEAYSQLGNILKEKKADGITPIVKNFSIETGSKTYIFLKNEINYKSTNQALNHFYQIRKNNIEALINILQQDNPTQELQKVIQQNKVFIQNEIKMASQISDDLSQPIVNKVAAETSQEAFKDTTSNVIGKHLKHYEVGFQEDILTNAYKDVFGKKSISSDNLQKATMDIIKQAQSAIPNNPATKDFKNQVINPLQTIFKDVNWEESISHSDLDTKLADLVNNINSIQDNKNLRFDSIQIKFKKPKQGLFKSAKESENLDGDNLFTFIDNFCFEPLKDEIESIRKLLKKDASEHVSQEILQRTKALKEFIENLNANLLLGESKENLQIISLFKPDQKILLNEWAFVVPVILFISEAVAWAVLDHYVGHYLRIESANLIEDGKFYYLKGQLNKSDNFFVGESFSNRNIKNLIIEKPQEPQDVNHQIMNVDITKNISQIINDDKALQDKMEKALNDQNETTPADSPSSQDLQAQIENTPVENTENANEAPKQSSDPAQEKTINNKNNNKSNSDTDEQDSGSLEGTIYTIPRLKGGYYTLAEILNDKYSVNFTSTEITGRSLRNLYQDKMLFAGDRIDFDDIIKNADKPKIYTFRKPNDNFDVFDKRDTVEVAMEKIKKARQERASLKS